VPVWRFERDGGWTTLGTSVRPMWPSQRLFLSSRTASLAPVPARMAAALAALAAGVLADA